MQTLMSLPLGLTALRQSARMATSCMRLNNLNWTDLEAVLKVGAPAASNAENLSAGTRPTPLVERDSDQEIQAVCYPTKSGMALQHHCLLPQRPQKIE